MKKFTYMDYIKAIHNLNLNSTLKFNEENTNYIINKDNKVKKDYIIEILKNKKEMAYFINKFLKFKEKILAEELIQVKNNAIQNNNNLNTIIYKQKGKEIFFLVAHTKEIKKETSYIMLNNSIEILQQWTKNKKNNGKKPIVIPIVLYTGKKKVKNVEPLKYNSIGGYEFENFEMTFEFNLIDARNILNEYLENL